MSDSGLGAFQAVRLGPLGGVTIMLGVALIARGPIGKCTGMYQPSSAEPPPGIRIYGGAVDVVVVRRAGGMLPMTSSGRRI